MAAKAMPACYQSQAWSCASLAAGDAQLEHISDDLRKAALQDLLVKSGIPPGQADKIAATAFPTPPATPQRMAAASQADLDHAASTQKRQKLTMAKAEVSIEKLTAIEDLM